MILCLYVLYVCVHLVPCASYLRCVSICSLAFSMEGLYLSASSNTETVHIFKLETQKEKYVYVSSCLRLFMSASKRLLRRLSRVFLFMLNRETQASHVLCAFVCRPAEEPTTWGGYLGKVLMASTTYLPSQVTEMFTQGRAFATVRLPFCGHKNICALAV